MAGRSRGASNLRLASGLLLCCLLAAAPPPRATNRFLHIPVWVGEGQTNGFRTADLQATLGGSSSPIVSIKGPGDDLMLLLVLDLSEDLSLVEPAKDALIADIGKLPHTTWVGLMRAQDGLRVLVDPTADRKAVTGPIQDLSVSGKAGLLDTVETAEQIGDAILAKSNVRVAVLYVTDSEISNYREDFTNPVINSSDIHDLSRKFPESLIQEKISKMRVRLATRQTPLFIVHLRYRTERLNEAYQNGLRSLADVTGGASVFCRSSAEIGDAVGHMFQLISSHYSVTLAVPDRRKNSLQVQLEARGRSLTYRTRFDLKEK